MSRYAPYLGAIAATAVFIVVVAVSGGVSELQVPSTASTTAQGADVNTVASSTAPTPLPKPQAKVPPDASAQESKLIAATAELRKALVNIICYAPAGGELHSITGSGVIVSPGGMILTNAHIGQHFLLADRGVSCSVRTGSPATITYKAALVFISPQWIQENAKLLTVDAPSGTGERDFALLAITGAAPGASVPAAYPYVPLAHTVPQVGESVGIASYGAQFLDQAQIESALSSTVVLSKVRDLLTFGAETPDVLGFVGSPASQEGSSGGGVVSASGALVGTIVTSKVTGPTSERFLAALTSLYIRSAYAREAGQTLEQLLVKPNATAVAAFEPQAAELRAILEKALADT